MQKQSYLQFFFDLQTKGPYKLRWCGCHDIGANFSLGLKMNWLLLHAKPRCKVKVFKLVGLLDFNQFVKNFGRWRSSIVNLDSYQWCSPLTISIIHSKCS